MTSFDDTFGLKQFLNTINYFTVRLKEHYPRNGIS